MFVFAGQPDVVRASQKDAYYIKQVYDQIKEVLPSRIQHIWDSEIKLFADLCYYILTTITSNITLGEEYCDIVQLDTLTNKPPSLLRRIALVFSRSLFPYFLDKGIVKLTKRISSENYRNIVDRLRNLIIFLERFHLALFYMSGQYLEISKRVNNIKYIYTGKNNYSRANFAVLGILILIQQVISLFIWIKNLIFNRSSMLIQEEEPMRDGKTSERAKCPHCLDNRRFTTATPCGHLFCWDCITKCITDKPKCPLCRRDVNFQNLVRVYHYE